jgi:hypothetical protein
MPLLRETLQFRVLVGPFFSVEKATSLRDTMKCKLQHSVSYFFTCSLSYMADFQAEQFKKYDMEQYQKYDTECCNLHLNLIDEHPFGSGSNGVLSITTSLLR